MQGRAVPSPLSAHCELLAAFCCCHFLFAQATILPQPLLNKLTGCTLGFWVKRTLGFHGLTPSCCHPLLQMENIIYRLLAGVTPTPRMPSGKKEAEKDLKRGCFY